MAMRLLVFAALYLSLTISAFNIITPTSGELIVVDEIYNLTWTTNDVPANFIILAININVPDPALLYATNGAYYLHGWGAHARANISGSSGHYYLNLSNWWSPIYSEVPHRPWSISLELYNPTENRTHKTILNDTIEVELISLNNSQHRRPQLHPIKGFAVLDGDGSKEGTAASGVWLVALSIAAPVVIISLAVCFLRYRWRSHGYGSLSNKGDVKLADSLSLNRPSATASSDNEERSRTSKSPGAHKLPRSFVLAAFLGIAPLLVLLTALILLLGLYRVRPSKYPRTDFTFHGNGSDPAAFYLDFDSTRYTTIASWTSSIALLLPGFLTSLIWYRETQQLESDAALAQYDKLLTPYQLSLLLNLKSGTLGSLWEYVSYIISRRREKQARFLSDTGFVVLLSTLLGLGLWVADTWLHVATSTISFTTAIPYTAFQSDFALRSYGRALSQNCTSQYLDSIGQDYSCILRYLLADIPFALDDPYLYTSIISGKNKDTAILPVTIGQERIAYIAPAYPRSQIDYRANTFAVRSLCKTIDEWCWLPWDSYGYLESPLSANCGNFVGNLTNSSAPIAYGTVVTEGVVGVVTSFFRGQQWQDVMTVQNTSNSFYTVSRLDSLNRPSANGLPYYWTITTSGVIYNSFIGCNTEFVNFTYTYANGSIRSADITPLGNLDMMNTIFLPVLLNVDPFLAGGAAATAMADDTDSAIENWIDTLHKHYLSFAATAVEKVDNINQQERHTKLVARITKGPLLTLIMLILLSILFNSYILVMSLWRTRLGKTHPKQVIVSVAGLAANSFESGAIKSGPAVRDIWDIFEESKEEQPSARIGISENLGGGYRFVSFATRGTAVGAAVLDGD